MTQSVRLSFVLKSFLWLIMFHSVGVGVSLIWHPTELLAYFGYAPCSEPFFPVQGGVFHIIMAAGYGVAAWDPWKFKYLVISAIVVKAMATIFLVVYWIFNTTLLVVLMSGLADGAMAVVLAILYNRWSKQRSAKEQS